jgi:hypothetical protein
MSELGARSRLVPVRLPCLIMIGVFGWLVLLGRCQASKDAETMILRHEIIAPRRRSPGGGRAFVACSCG